MELSKLRTVKRAEISAAIELFLNIVSDYGIRIDVKKKIRISEPIINALES